MAHVQEKSGIYLGGSYLMGELFKTQHTIDEMLDRMGIEIVLDGEHLTEDDRREAEKLGDIVKIAPAEEREKQQKK